MSQQSDVTDDSTPEMIVVHDHGTGVEVTSAPQYAEATLELLVGNRSIRGVMCRGNMISFGGHENQWVSYQVVGLGQEGRTLLLVRED